MQAPPADSAEAQRIIDEARATIAAWRRTLAATGVTPEACLEALRRAEGETAVAAVRRSVEETVRNVRQEAQRDALHGGTTKPVARHIARRRTI